MKKCITSATFKAYNANNRGNNVGDCVKRAISLAFDIDYNKLGKMLVSKAKELHSDAWNYRSVYSPIIKELGGGAPIFVKSQDIQTVAEFIDNVATSGVYLFETSRRPDSPIHHITVAIDGTLYDSWDSSEEYVRSYWVIENVHHNFTDLKEYNEELFKEGKDLIKQLCTKYINKYVLDGVAKISQNSRAYDYNLVYYIYYGEDYSLDKYGRYKDLKLTCVFTPTTSPETARKKMLDTIKVRMYDFFYAINKKIESNIEGDSLVRKSGYSDEVLEQTVANGWTYLNGTEKRFYNSLPGKVRPFIYDISINPYTDAFDKYQLKMLPIPGDPRFNPNIPDNTIKYNHLIHFEAYDSAMMKSMISDYLNNWERPYEDYDVYERY